MRESIKIEVSFGYLVYWNLKLDDNLVALEVKIKKLKY